MAKTIVIPIESNELLGRVIGREGRNIRELIRQASKLGVDLELPVKIHSPCIILRGRDKEQVEKYIRSLLNNQRITPSYIQQTFAT